MIFNFVKICAGYCVFKIMVVGYRYMQMIVCIIIQQDGKSSKMLAFYVVFIYNEIVKIKL